MVICFFQVSRIPALRFTFWRRESLCELLQSMRLVSTIRSLIPSCYAIPQHKESLSAVANVLPDSTLWVVKASVPTGGVSVVDNARILDDLRENR